MTLTLAAAWLGIGLMLLIGFGGVFATAKMAATQNIALVGPLAGGELRVALGSNFLVLGAAMIWFRSPELFLIIAAMWTLATVVKIVSFLLDRPPLPQALVGIGVDVVMAVLTGCGYLAFQV